MKVLKGIKPGTQEKRIYVLPETEEEAQRFGRIAQSGQLPHEMATCLYEYDKIRETGNAIVLRFLPVASGEDMENMMRAATSKFVNIREIYSKRPDYAKITFLEPLDKDNW